MDVGPLQGSDVARVDVALPALDPERLAVAPVGLPRDVDDQLQSTLGHLKAIWALNKESSRSQSNW